MIEQKARQASCVELPAIAQQSPPNLVEAYDGLADSILGMRQAEANLSVAVARRQDAAQEFERI